MNGTRKAIPSRAAAAVALIAVSCAGSRSRLPDTVPAGQFVATYRAELREEDGRTRKFRLLLFAAPPDRLHAEIVSPVGSIETIVDAGGGRISVAYPRDRVAYVGEAAEPAVESLVGLRLTPEQIVAALLDGRVPRTAEAFSRSAQPEGSLPHRFSVSAGGRSLRLRLSGVRRLAVDPGTLGRGMPPPGVAHLPIEELPPARSARGDEEPPR